MKNSKILTIYDSEKYLTQTCKEIEENDLKANINEIPKNIKKLQNMSLDEINLLSQRTQ